MIPRYTINQAMVKLSAQRPLNLEAMRLGKDSPAHDHDYYEICLVREGRAVHHTVWGSQVLTPGMVIVVAPRGVHAFSAPRNFRVINIYYLAEWLSAGWREQWGERGLIPLFLGDFLFASPAPMQPVVFTLPAPTQPRVERLVDDLQTELHEPRPSPLLLKAGFLQLLAHLARGRDDSAANLDEATWQVLRAIELCIEQSQPFDLKEITVGRSVSADRSSRLFKQATGLSPQQYYQRRRVHHACSRLLNPDWTNTEVAMQLGYADAPHFCRMFKQHTGLSPWVYRRKYRVDAVG